MLIQLKEINQSNYQLTIVTAPLGYANVIKIQFEALWQF